MIKFEEIVNANKSKSSQLETMIRDFLFTKKNRPKNKCIQFEIIEYIYLIEDLSHDLRFYSAIALGHKSIEMLSVEKMCLALKLLNSLEKNGLDFESSDNFRKDITHATFSLKAIKLFLYLFLSDKESFYKELKIVFNLVKTIDTKSLGNGFFQSSTNIIRTLGLAFLCSHRIGLKENDILELSEKVLFLGLFNDKKKRKLDGDIILSDVSLIKFSSYREFFNATKTDSLMRFIVENEDLNFLRYQLMMMCLRHRNVLDEQGYHKMFTLFFKGCDV